MDKNYVLAVIGDQKLPVLQGGMVVSFEAHVISSQDYSPFGVTLSGRSWSAGYRYGFKGQEIEDGITGSRTHTSAESWMYDARLGRRWEIDPVYRQFLSNYSTLNCSPIFNFDWKGDSPETSGQMDPGDKYAKKFKRFTERMLRKKKDPSLDSFREKYSNRRWFKDHVERASSMREEDLEPRRGVNIGPYDSSQASNGSFSSTGGSGAPGANPPAVVTGPTTPGALGAGTIYTWGYNVVTRNVDGTYTAINIGTYTTGLVLVYNPGVTGCTAGTPVRCNPNGDIINDSGAVIYPLPRNARINDIFLSPVEVTSFQADSGGRRGNWNSVSTGAQAFRMDSNGIWTNITLTLP